jgi:hypothetical protein
MGGLEVSAQISRPGIFSDTKQTRIITRHLEEAKERANKLRRRLIKALENPAQNDPVYQICQRIFQKSDDLVLKRDSRARHSVRQAALRRFLQGCPPRKTGDTSYGDGFNVSVRRRPC